MKKSSGSKKKKKKKKMVLLYFDQNFIMVGYNVQFSGVFTG